MLLLIFAPQPPAAQAEYINLASALGDVYSALNAAGPSDLVFWTETELYQYFDEAAERLARTVGCFVERDTSLTTAVNTGTYGLPTDQVAVVQADMGGQVLRPRNVHELEALDYSWPMTVGPPVAFVKDTAGMTSGSEQMTIYPACDEAHEGLTIGLVLHVLPATISSSNALLGAPTAIREYFTFRALEAARGKQSKAEMPDVANWFGQLAGYMEQVMSDLWGSAT